MSLAKNIYHSNFDCDSHRCPKYYLLTTVYSILPQYFTFLTEKLLDLDRLQFNPLCILQCNSQEFHLKRQCLVKRIELHHADIKMFRIENLFLCTVEERNLLIVIRYSLLFTCYSFFWLVIRYIIIVTQDRLLITCYFLLFASYLLLFTRCSLFFTHCLWLCTWYSLLFARGSLLFIRCLLLFPRRFFLN